MTPNLAQQLEDFRLLARENAAVSAPAVSGWSVGMHVQHCVLGTGVLLEALGDGRPPRRLLSPTPIGWLVLLTGRIPRGRAKSPPAVVPEPPLPTEALLELVDRTEARLAGLDTIPDNAWVKHFVAGFLNKRRAVRFLAVHNAHHRAIIADILKAAGVPDPSA